MGGMQGLDEALRLKRVHRRWAILNASLGAAPVFALVNKFQPMLTDGYGGDMIPTLLPDGLFSWYNTLLAGTLAALTLSELLRRRFHRIHEADLRL